MIDIAELGGKKIKDINGLIEAENTSEYEVYVPKSTQIHFSEMSAIAYDYAYAAYSGQLLAEIATSFQYKQVPPEIHESILFTVKTENKEALANIIMEISYLYVNDREDPEYIDIEDVNTFLEKVEKAEIEPACPYFTKIYFEIIKDGNMEDEE